MREQISREHQLDGADRVAAVLPLHHINAFAVTMLAPLAHGGSLVMPPKFSAAGLGDGNLRHGCTWLNVVPTIIWDISSKMSRRERHGGIRFCRSASAITTGTPSRVLAKFGIGIVETMGPPRQWLQRLESDRAATAQDRIGRESVGLRGARGRRRRRAASRWNCWRDRDSRAA